MILIPFLAALALPACNQAIQDPDAAASRSGHASLVRRGVESVVIYGSGCSLFANLGRPGVPRMEDVWDAFTQDLRRIGASHVFGLGDHALPSCLPQWESTRRHLSEVGAEKHLLRGDFDTWDLPGYGEAGGGPRNRTVDIGANRFVMLDDRKLFSEADLRFLEEACAPRGEPGQTFVLTHSRLHLKSDDASNWNRDVVPILLRSGVRYVFCGEDNRELLASSTIPKGDADPRLYYFCVGFHDSGYRGPGLYVELRFRDGRLESMLPRAIPLDVRHPWFHFHPASWNNQASRAQYGDWKPDVEESGPYAGRVRWAWPDQKQQGVTRMALYGHAYALHIDNHDDGRIHSEELISAFIDELNRLEFDHVFALGDHVFDPRSKEEWKLVERQYDRLAAKVHMVRGNHEWWPKLPVLEKYGCVEPNTFLDIGRNRFILFGYREVYSKEDLLFLDDAIAGHEDRRNTFFLTHLMSFQYRPVSEAPPGVDPNKPYGGYSNWNTDVAPVLKDRVHYAFFGDIYSRLAGHLVNPYGTYYICSGFMFRGERAMVYLDLEFRGDELWRVIPRTIPIDLRNEWYHYVH
ncbi:MAG: hypothetical protein Fur0037_07110 [Planctomycetota bacterium]